MIQPERPGLIDGREALAGEFRRDPGDRMRLCGKRSHPGETVALAVVAHREPLGDPPRRVTDEQRDPPAQELHRGDGLAVPDGADLVDQGRGGLLGDVVIVNGSVAARGVQLALQETERQVGDRTVVAGDRGGLPRQRLALLQERARHREVRDQEAAVLGHGRERRLPVLALDREVDEGAAVRVDDQRCRAERVGDLGSQGADIVREAHAILMAEDQGGPVRQPHGQGGRAWITRGVGGDPHPLGERQPFVADHLPVTGLEEHRPAIAGKPEADLGILLGAERQGLCRPAGDRIARLRLDRGGREERQDHVEEIDEDEEDGDDDGDPARGHEVAGPAVLQEPPAPMRLRLLDPPTRGPPPRPPHPPAPFLSPPHPSLTAHRGHRRRAT